MSEATPSERAKLRISFRKTIAAVSGHAETVARTAAESTRIDDKIFSAEMKQFADTLKRYRDGKP